MSRSGNASGTYNYKVKIHNYNEEQWDQKFSEKYRPPRLIGTQQDTFQTMYHIEHSLENSIVALTTQSQQQQPQQQQQLKTPSGLLNSSIHHSLKSRTLLSSPTAGPPSDSSNNTDFLKSSFPGHQPALDFYNHPVRKGEKTANEYYFETTSRATFIHPKQMQEKGEILTYMPADELDKYRKTWTQKQARDMKTEYQRQHCK
ncbi:hypothetical protein FDP41_010600 [Naegleria fowleri]|uniref:Uncharacterized protein n=1 Tax=Naegleria fowleri TaxID=5763 RepID=A0A6A5CDV2_NAEFO|nr:uncharacterized protein FDP41_010600 [Naegleria fowleri]KAF0983535.1 hypothetical protein FDP41_010600 [Naegleria fowleri]CAG4718052.1 unnamed protein product [Naegleria fowleri]